MKEQHDSLTTYRVRVGHWELQLRARDADEALQLARRRLARELPRLYDVIQNMTAARFQIEAAA